MTITGYTYKQLQDEVIAHQLSDAKYRPLVQVWLNEAQRFIYLQTDIPTAEVSSSITTVAATSTSSLPSDFARIIDLRNTTDQFLLVELDLRDFDQAPPSSGKPTNYTIIGNTINMYPTPDAVYSLSLRYWNLPTDMTADGDTPSLPAQWQHLMIRYCLVRAFQRENDYEAATYFEQELTAGINKLRGEAQYRGQDGPRQVQGAWAGMATPPGRWY